MNSSSYNERSISNNILRQLKFNIIINVTNSFYIFIIFFIFIYIVLFHRTDNFSIIWIHEERLNSLHPYYFNIENAIKLRSDDNRVSNVFYRSITWANIL